MANSKLSQPIFCAAIDFGTTYTGLAFAEWGKAKYVASTWSHDGLQGIELKAPTAVLFDAGRNFEAFGFDAVKKYSRKPDKHKQDCYYFERFKMELHHQEKFNENLMLRSTNNPKSRSMKAIKVIAEVMKFLKNKLMKMFKDAKFDAKDTDIRWVITVPAIWKASARQLMRRAAYEAGLCDKNEPHNIIISLEPESAALFVHDYLELKEKGISDESVEASMEGLNLLNGEKRTIKYNKYLILDCGGGTVDVCVHQVLNGEDGFTVRECYRATGGAWGGIYVDKEFFEFLEKIFTVEFIKKAKETLLTAWADICRDFEYWKRQVEIKDNDKDPSSDIAPIGLPFDFIMECQKHHSGKQIDDIVKESKIDGATFEMGKLNISGKVMRKFLMSQISKIIDHVRLLQKTNECYGFNAIFLVGGFSESKLLQSAVKNAFSKKCEVVVPISPSLAIVKGSIKFGFNPTVISQRVAQFTYGLSKMRKFEDGDKEEYKYKTAEGELYCENIFMEIMRELTPITKQNCLYVSNYVPIEKDQKGIGISLLKSSRVDVKYTKEKCVEKIGHLHVPMPGTGLDRKVQVTVDFSGTEIFASVKNLITNEVNFISVDFLSADC